MARTLGGVRIDRDTPDLKRKRLHNVVEEMAIASGVPMPEIYVLEQEQGINAFAAGHTPANAAVAVTQGALDRLNRDELQGVIAHEFSHVLNGDMRLNVQLMGWLFGLFAIALIGRTLLRFAPRSRKGGGGLMVAALAVMILGYVGLVLRAPASGGGEPAARAACRCLGRAVHAQSRRAEGRAAEDRGRANRVRSSAAMRSRWRTCCSRRACGASSRRIRRSRSAFASSIRAST